MFLNFGFLKELFFWGKLAELFAEGSDLTSVIAPDARYR
jgi:hypothetical protein